MPLLKPSSLNLYLFYQVLHSQWRTLHSWIIYPQGFTGFDFWKAGLPFSTSFVLCRTVLLLFPLFWMGATTSLCKYNYQEDCISPHNRKNAVHFLTVAEFKPVIIKHDTTGAGSTFLYSKCVTTIKWSHSLDSVLRGYEASSSYTWPGFLLFQYIVGIVRSLITMPCKYFKNAVQIKI